MNSFGLAPLGNHNKDYMATTLIIIKVNYSQQAHKVGNDMPWLIPLFEKFEFCLEYRNR